MITKSRSDSWLESARQEIENHLQHALDNPPIPSTRLRDAMRYSLLAGGKRLRPLLCLAACELHGQPRALALPAAVAVEMVHTYSLIHDDLPAMDNDDLRRGKPSCHRAFDEATAILAGDALLTHAFALLATAKDYPPEIRLQMIRLLSQAAGPAGMVAGQMQDMEAAEKQLDQAALETLHGLKTGRLIQASLVLGALAAGITDDTTLAHMTAIGEKLGLAFQVQDDVLDVTQTSATLGKSAGKDAAQHKNTFPALLGLGASQAHADELCRQALALLDSAGASASALAALARELMERQH